MHTRVFGFVSAHAILAATAVGNAAPITPGNLAVTHILGTGGAGAAVQIEEYTSLGLHSGNTIAMPTTTVGSNRRFVNIGSTAAMEGFLTLSTDGRYLMSAGWDAAVGTGALGSSTNPRVVSRIDVATGIIDTTTAMTGLTGGDAFIRSAAMDGSNIWTTMGSGGGVRHTTFGTVGLPTIISATPVGSRVANIFDGQLYASTASGTNNGGYQGPYTVGVGLPTTSGQAAVALPGFPTAPNTNNSWDYWLADATTLFVADSRAIGSGGGLQRWSLSAGSWTLEYTLTGGLTAGLLGLTGVVEGGVTTLYATTNDPIGASAGNKLVSVIDTGAGSAFTTLATAANGSSFRGVELVPEPATGVLILIAGLAVARRRR